MPAPAAYTEGVFAAYLTSVLGEVAPLLGWDQGAPAVQEAVADALLELGVSTIADVTTTFQIRGIRALGRRAIWRAVVQATAAKYDFSDSDARFSRSQINSQALEMLKVAEADCLQWTPGYAVNVVSVHRPQDPYQVLLDSQRVP